MYFRLQSLSVSFGLHSAHSHHKRFTVCSHRHMQILFIAVSFYLLLSIFSVIVILLLSTSLYFALFFKKNRKKGSRSCRLSSYCCRRSYFVIFNPIETINGCAITWIKWFSAPTFYANKHFNFCLCCATAQRLWTLLMDSFFIVISQYCRLISSTRQHRSRG